MDYIPSPTATALNLMGDWCGCKIPTHYQEITGAGRELNIKPKPENSENVCLCKGKNEIFLNGGVYSLTKGLLMGDPNLGRQRSSLHIFRRSREWKLTS